MNRDLQQIELLELFERIERFLQQDVTDYPRKGKRLYRNSGERNLVDHSNIERINR